MSAIINFFSGNTTRPKEQEVDWIDYSPFFNQISPLPNRIKSIDYVYNIESEKRNSNILSDFYLDSNLVLSIENLNGTENKINQNREAYLNEKKTPILLALLREEDFEFGYITRSEELIREQIKINELATKNWINEIFIKYFHDEIILIGILRILGRFEENVIFPQGQTIALASLSHQNDEIKELGIRTFEKWCSIDSLSVLKKLKVETGWLQDYINQVIADFEETLCHI